ncbi:hypothetical protein RV11_GL000098 [Enterococcus phoeniculicola]|jgi:cell fate (sporulation/competence/biofilm development) regulator YmcA (YheA/YmcA/DUF963 family)|uniref:Cell fate regulator YmcA, YheA/YmcA/DUF963 family (Controls sporulation, competence, biofilm development) n=1 Tax=Enterococcus phoeniculicola ATCC BAA-412 TaxID=1158610 RepID=R3TV56_9ENTE|nr:YlbF family regulator [Enterococcus phoeniculicola]EOL45469.1 hypothetical protein UC3_01359 [Enterococcus phoeniculicola ATCC BAA-412]EOT74831.1 hypothetical protein I589_02431 [Enterococcus phoeniculicola ATCC BAA-412]OJG73732.1 hypothetical protein RV11_GL000098 [Enterococcus phoeniculicola]
MDSLEQEAAVKTALDRLSELLEHNEVIQKYKALKQRVEQNKHLDELIEKIKQAQKDAVQFAHYGKPEAEREAIKEADRLTEEFNQHPLVLAYRTQLVEANDLVHHLTDLIQRKVNEGLEGESVHASKD